MIKLTEILDEILFEKKLCPKGRAYYNRRKAAGEKPSAYLSGRAVKVCKGLMEEDDLDMHESLRDWFKKEDWVRIDTAGNITGPCGTMKKGNKTTRCLPRAKANSLTKAERAATSKKKASSYKQFVPNTDKAKVKLKEGLEDTSWTNDKDQTITLQQLLDAIKDYPVVQAPIEKISKFVTNSEFFFEENFDHFKKININDLKEFKKILNPKNISRKECLLLPFKALSKALNF